MKSMWMLNSTAYGRVAPLYAPPGERGGGGGGDQGGDDLSLDDSDLDFGDDDQNPILENQNQGDEFELELDEDGNEINVDDDGFLGKLFAPEKKVDKDGNSIPDEDDDEAGDSQAEQQAIANDMKAALASLSVPEDAIPEDFNASDPKQLRTLLTTIQRQTAQETIRIMWRPIAAAMNQTVVRMRQESQAMVANGIGENSLESQMLSAIPAYGNPAYRAVIKTVQAQAARRFAGDNRKIVAATRKAVLAMGINLNAGGKQKSGGGGNGGRPMTPRQRTDSVLDQFAKIPDQAREQQRPNDRLRNRLQR
jgi:pyruvate/2-oxoglutarate dehydrogenase complex dihydrolipoamide acyltransferase (E2) component